jgi:hypothetical protein
VCQREHLCRLGIGAVNKDQRRERIYQGEAAEFLRIEPAVRVVGDDTVHHDQHADSIGLLDKPAQRFGPARNAAPLLDVKAKLMPDRRRDFQDIARQRRGAHKGERLLPLQLGILAIPLLPLLAKKDRIQEVRARTLDAPSAGRPKIGDGQLLDAASGAPSVTVTTSNSDVNVANDTATISLHSAKCQLILACQT